MQIVLLLLAALVPVVILLWFIFKKDSTQPEPVRMLLKAFMYGMLSVLLSFVFSMPTAEFFELEISPETYSSIGEAVADAFLLAAIPEEVAKLIMLWLLLRKNPFFDEKFDGIVYAACIGLGFAGFENVMYLVEGLEDGSWLGTGISRALFSVPGHFLFAVCMGYYYSLYHFGVSRKLVTKAMILIAPVMAHGIFDSILMSMQIDDTLSFIGMVIFLFFFIRLKNKGKERINQMKGK